MSIRGLIYSIAQLLCPPELFLKTALAGIAVLRFCSAGARKAVLFPAAVLCLHAGKAGKLFLRLTDEVMQGLFVHAAGALVL